MLDFVASTPVVISVLFLIGVSVLSYRMLITRFENLYRQTYSQIRMKKLAIVFASITIGLLASRGVYKGCSLFCPPTAPTPVPLTTVPLTVPLIVSDDVSVTASELSAPNYVPYDKYGSATYDQFFKDSSDGASSASQKSRLLSEM